MRYQNWDVLLFPARSKIPLQEFKSSCHVVHDPETLHQRNSVLLLPTVTSFIHALPAGEPFRISVHSWEDPLPSRYAQGFSKEPEDVMFEARVFIDGKLAGAKVFASQGPWPMIIETSLDIDKNGEMENMKFPVFHRELLTQSYWNAGDELGRIKVTIAEGIGREPLLATLDRIKNIVSFSFQHAPLDILEASAIAWPNAAMWRQVSFNASYLPHGISPRHVRTTGVEAHSHSPRHKSASSRPPLPPPALGPMPHPAMQLFSRQGNGDPFIEPVHHWRQFSTADVSMPDYSNSTSRASQSRRITDPMMSDRSDRRYETMSSAGAYESICEALLPSAPDNTPKNDVVEQHSGSTASKSIQTQAETGYYPIKFEECHPTPLPGLNSGFSGVKSRKENMHESPGLGEHSGSAEGVRKVAQPFSSLTGSGTKRQRVVTPASFKVIDEEDEPRSSPVRKVTIGTAIPEGEAVVASSRKSSAATSNTTDRDRMALSDIESNL